MWEDATSCEAETKLCVVSSVFLYWEEGEDYVKSMTLSWREK